MLETIYRFCQSIPLGEGMKNRLIYGESTKHNTRQIYQKIVKICILCKTINKYLYYQRKVIPYPLLEKKVLESDKGKY